MDDTVLAGPPGSLTVAPILHERIYVVVLQGGEAMPRSVAHSLWPGAARQAWVPCQPYHHLSKNGRKVVFQLAVVCPSWSKLCGPFHVHTCVHHIIVSRWLAVGHSGPECLQTQTLPAPFLVPTLGKILVRDIVRHNVYSSCHMVSTRKRSVSNSEGSSF